MAVISCPNGLRLVGNAWYLRMSILTLNGKSKPRDIALRIYGADKQAQAEAAATKKRAELREKNDEVATINKYPALRAALKVESAVMTLQTWWERYRKAYVAGLATEDDIVRMITNWLALPRTAADGTPTTWGASRLDEITQSDVKLALRARRATKKQHGTGTLSAGSVRKEHGCLQSFIEKAIADEVVVRGNPFGAIDKGQDVSRETILEREHQAAFLAMLPNDRTRRIVDFMLSQGLRVGGAIAVRVTNPAGRSDIFERRGYDYIHVSEKCPPQEHPNTCQFCGRVGRKCRNVPLLADGKAILDAQIAADHELWGAIMLSKKTMDEDYVEKAIARAGVYADLPYKVGAHVLRHTFSMRWVEADGDIDTLSEILGHSTRQVTERFYKHVREETTARRMRAVLEPATATPPEPEPETPAKQHLTLVKSA